MNPARYRSFFWPGVLILAGVIALLVNTGTLSGERLILLLDLWPVILIVVGLEIVIRRTWRGAQADIAGALVVAVAIAGSVAYVALTPNQPTQTRDTSAEMISGLEKASLEINVAAATVDMSGTGDLGGKLYTAHFTYSGQGPTVVESNGAVTISENQNHNFPFFRSDNFSVVLKLNSSIPWSVIMNSGATTDHLDLGSVHVAGLSLNTAASTDDITLGPPSGIVPVTIDGAAMTVRLHRRSDTPVSVVVSGAGVTLDTDGHHASGVGKLTYFTPDFAGAADAYSIRIDGAACTVTLDTAASD